MPPKKKTNHIHIPANPERVKQKEIKNRHKDRKEKGKPEKVSNEMIFEMLMDIMEKQEFLEKQIMKASSPVEQYKF